MSDAIGCHLPDHTAERSLARSLACLLVVLTICVDDRSMGATQGERVGRDTNRPPGSHRPRRETAARSQAAGGFVGGGEGRTHKVRAVVFVCHRRKVGSTSRSLDRNHSDSHQWEWNTLKEGFPRSMGSHALVTPVGHIDFGPLSFPPLVYLTRFFFVLA